MNEIKIVSSKEYDGHSHTIDCWKCNLRLLEGIESSIDDILIFECKLCNIYLGVCGKCNSKLCINLYPAQFNIFLNPLLNELYNNFNSYHLNILNLERTLKIFKCLKNYEDEFITFFSNKYSNKISFYHTFSSNDFRDIQTIFKDITLTITDDKNCSDIPYWRLNNFNFEINVDILGDIVGYNGKNISRWFCQKCDKYFYFKI